MTDEERHVADFAERTYRRFVVPMKATGMCYRLTFFLAVALRDQGISVEPVVGYINDGETDLMASHAWIECNGKRLDLSLGLTDQPDVQLPGQVLILDRVIKPGTIYTYHRQRSEAAEKAVREFSKMNPMAARFAEHKEREHAVMGKTAQSLEAMRSWLDAAPDGLTVARITRGVLG